jgi:hypothetical protein
MSRARRSEWRGETGSASPATAAWWRSSLGPGVGGLWLLVLGIGRVVAGSGAELKHAGDAHALADSLEVAVAYAGAGALLLLVALVALVVLLKELSDDAARRARGPVVSDEPSPGGRE